MALRLARYYEAASDGAAAFAGYESKQAVWEETLACKFEPLIAPAVVLSSGFFGRSICGGRRLGLWCNNLRGGSRRGGPRCRSSLLRAWC